MTKRFLHLVVFTALASGAAGPSAIADPPRELDQAERELVRIGEAMRSDYDKLYAREDELKDEAEREKFDEENDPSPKYVALFEEFERSHHGTHAGLMAARQLILDGARGGELDNVRDLGRRRILTVLNDYASAPELPELLRFLAYGNAEPAVETFLRRLIDEPGTSEQNRAFAQVTLGQWCFAMRDNRESLERRLKELERGAKPYYSKEAANLSKGFAAALPPGKIAALQREAIEVLESLAECPEDLRQPGVTDVDKNGFIVDVSREKTNSMPGIKTLAAALLFKQRHLREGAESPELELELVDGAAWKLADQRGKVVVIQFSFKGCGPCEAMYPELRSMIADHGDKLTVLSIMADENRSDTVDAVKSGKLAWNVCWDGFRGPIATRWSVRGFPTVYVVKPDGRMAASHLYGEQLRAAVAELLR